MTPFSLLSGAAGLSHREASVFLSVQIDTVKSWSCGRNRCPQGALDEMKALIHCQSAAAEEHLKTIKNITRKADAVQAVELGYPADDHEAQTLGWPCVGAWRGMAARVLAASTIPITLVPRGSTPATAAAIDAHAHLDRRG